MKYTLTLAHGPNEDIQDGGYWRAPNAPPLIFVNVNTLQEAKELFEAWRDDNGLGSGNLTLVSGIVSTFPAGGFVGQFSYNGRLWDKPELAKERNEISVAFMDKYSSDEVVPHYDDGSDAILEANPVLKSDGFEDKARRWNVLLAQARALNLTPAEQVEFIKKGQQQ